jgi:hypothetical protein
VPAPSDQTSGGSPETTRPPIRPHPQRRKPRFGQTLLTHLIGTDRELAEQLLNDQVITTEHLTEAIFGQRNAVLEQLGPLLLDHGIDPEDIAALAGADPPGFSFEPGPSKHEQRAEYFASLGERVPALLPVATAGQAQQKVKQQEEEKRQRSERIRER